MTSDHHEGPTPGGDVGVTLETPREVLASSVDRLTAVVHSLTPQQLRQQAYPSKWTVAQVLSHLGSGAVITRLRLDGDVDMQAVWDEWNAKDPDAQAADSLRADAALQARLASITPGEAAGLRFAMGPTEIDLTAFIGLRLNEHAVHTWDIVVTFDDSATIPTAEAELIMGTLPMMAGFAGKPTGTERTLSVRTKEPERSFEIALRSDGVALSPRPTLEAPDLELPGEALVRLVYGRLDSAHSPTIAGNATDLEELRKAFPGI
jgi:uncharacterized protein (TIGR03083 family)